jgi:phosphoribosylanthranilate isomerase
MSAHRTRVKVCGICSAAGAVAAVRAGADAVGVVLTDSPRRVTLDEARDVLRAVPPFVARVGVFVDPTLAEVTEAVESLGLTAVQLHGEESPGFCQSMTVPVVKGFRVRDGFRPAVVEPYRGRVAAVLLDTYVAWAAGGTGRAFAWDDAVLPDGIPAIVAGGLTPANVGECIRAMRPYAVDVSSGVEESIRVKDPALLEAFIAAIGVADGQE